jgi:hypothetical protein
MFPNAAYGRPQGPTPQDQDRAVAGRRLKRRVRGVGRVCLHRIRAQRRAGSGTQV